MPAPRVDLRRGVVEPVALLISRHEIEAGDPLPVVGRLLALLSTPEAIWRYRGQMALVVDSYNEDPRELVDIAEVRAILREFDDLANTGSPQRSRPSRGCHHRMPVS